MAVTLKADLPDDVWAALQTSGYTLQTLSDEALHHLAGVLYTRRALSLEQAARLAGLSLWDFIPFLSSEGIAVADYDTDEVERELETSRWLAKVQGS